MSTTPRCPFHVSIEMVPLEPSKKKHSRVSKSSPGGSWKRDGELLAPGETDRYTSLAFRCPVPGCPCVSQVNPGGVGEAVDVPKLCADCTKPIDGNDFRRKFCSSCLAQRDRRRSLEQRRCRVCRATLGDAVANSYGRICDSCRRAQGNERSRAASERERRNLQSARSQKKLACAAVLLLFCALAPSAHAGAGSTWSPLKKTAAPFRFVAKSVGRTFSNFVTWRDPARNLVYLGYAASIALDLHSTSRFVHVCPICRETNPVLGTRPSDRTLALDGAGEFLLGTTISTAFREKKRMPIPLRIAPFVAIGAVSFGHVNAAHGNYQIPNFRATPIRPEEPAR